MKHGHRGRTWLGWALTLALGVLGAQGVAWAQVVPIAPDSVPPGDSALFPPPTPNPLQRDSLLQQINARPAIERFQDTTKLGQQPDSLEQAGVDIIQPSRGEGPLQDSGKVRWPRPGLAARLSLVIPGAGQVYNRQWWKVPLVWGAVATTGYFYQFWNREYLRYKDAYAYRISLAGRATPPGFVNVDLPFVRDPDPFPRRSTNGLRLSRDQARRFRDYNAFFFLLTWTLNSVEAYVAAHLRHFSVSDDLTLQVAPTMQALPLAEGGEILPVPALQLRLVIH